MRGSGGDGVGKERLTRVVPGWVPLLLSWRAAGAGPWRVSLQREGQPALSAMVSRPFVRIDVATHCAAGCNVTIAQGDGRFIVARGIIPAAISEVQMPRWLDRADDVVERALLGAWLAERLGDPTWEEQGDSLMWQAACLYPAVYERLASRIPSIMASDPCALAPLAFALGR